MDGRGEKEGKSQIYTNFITVSRGKVKKQNYRQTYTLCLHLYVLKIII